MATEVKLPDLGEGIEDVTINRWLAAEGASVNEGDVILEVATDKVDTEVTAPVSGVLLKQFHTEGSLVGVSEVLAMIGVAGESVSVRGSAATESAPAPVSAPQPQAAPAAPSDKKATPVAQRVAQDQGVDLGQVGGTGPGGKITKDDVLSFAETKDAAPAKTGLPGDLADVPSLVVARTVAQTGVNLAEVAAGRPFSSLTKYDILSAAASQDAGKTVVVAPAYDTVAAAPVKATPSTPSTPSTPAPTPKPTPAQPAPNDELIKLSRMRQLVAKNTAESAFTAPHVTTMWDVDMTALLTHRAANKREFDAAGVKLTVTPYLFMAILAGLRAVPAANASWTDEGVIIKRTYNIGMAVALPMDANGMGGLIVPVIKNAGDLNLMGLARAVNDLAERARTNKLSVAELQGGTFTLSNYGVSGSRFQTPVIVQPQVGILGVGNIEKRAVVISQGHPLDPNRGDYMAFRPMTTLGFSYDHRVLDGATADAFCAAVKGSLEGWG